MSENSKPFVDETKDNEEEIFRDFSEMSSNQREIFSEMYEEKAAIPGANDAMKGISGIVISGGFATAIVHTDLQLSLFIGFLMVLTVFTFYYYLLKTSISFDNLSDISLSIALEDARKETDNTTRSVSGYVCTNFLNSPFTLPWGNPKVFVPKETVSSLTREEHQAVFEHELGHHKNTSINLIVTAFSIVSMFLIAPLLLLLFNIRPNVDMFLILVGYGLFVSILTQLLQNYDERVADNSVSNPTNFTTALVKLSDQIPHAETKIDKIAHQIIDPHPPINDRIEKVTNKSLHYTKSKTILYKVMTLLSVIFFTVGSVLVGYGFLTFSEANISPIYLFYGTIFVFLGVLSKFYPKFQGKSFIWVIIAVSLSFGFTVLIGLYLGANSIVESVALGRMGRRVLFLLIGLVIVNLYFISPAITSSQITSEEVDSVANGVLSEYWKTR